MSAFLILDNNTECGINNLKNLSFYKNLYVLCLMFYVLCFMFNILYLMFYV